MKGEFLRPGCTTLLQPQDELAVGHVDNLLYTFESPMRVLFGQSQLALLRGDWLGTIPKKYLGSGSTECVVALVDNVKDSRESVMKRIPVVLEHAVSAQWGDRETRIMRVAQGSPHIVVFIGCGTTRFYNFIEMEFMAGGSLLARMLHVPLKESEIIWFAHQVLKGLQHLHAANIIHRDIKPANILLARNQTLAKIADLSHSTTARQSVSVVGSEW